MIKFKKVRYRNFLAVGDRFTEIDLDRSPTTLVTGHNGSGKTTILEAIVYGLYGKPYRPIKVGGLVNSINKKQLVVEVEFQIGTKQYKVVRGQKPKVFEIYVDGELVEADAAAKDYQARLEAILGMDYRLFTQVVILNKARFVPFMALSAGDRRKVVEDILDIGIFSGMNEATKKKLSEWRNVASDLDYNRDMKKKDVELQERLIAQAQANVDSQIEDRQAKSEELRRKIDSENDEAVSLNDTVQALLSGLTDKAEVSSTLNDLQMKTLKIIANKEKEDEVIEFFSKDSCPTCEQAIGEELKKEKLETAEHRRKLFSDGIDQIHEMAKKYADRYREIEKVDAEIEELNRKLQNCQASVKYMSDELARNEFEIKKLQEKSSDTSENEQILTELKVELEKIESEYQEAKEEQKAYENLLTILKDNGVKAQIIKQHLPMINKAITKYLQDMGFNINFHLDENFNESFLSGNRGDFSYYNLSDGQKLRVDLAILFAWIDVAASKNSVNTNILFLDEILEAMDFDGIQLFLGLCRERLKNKNLYVISQRGDELKDNFRSEISFQLQDGFTTIKTV